MDQYTFHGPYAYRWVDHVPIERIHLGSGERLPLRLGERCRLPASLAPAGEPLGAGPRAAEPGLEASRAAMAAWN